MSVVIRLNGTDITNDVIIADAEFTALVNGQAGQAHLRVRDDHQTYNFTTGKELTLDIDSVRVWGGFVTAARKVFALPVVKTTNPTAVKRIWSITGADYNVLFDKRFLFKASDPAGQVFFSYATSTYDDTIINDVFDNYLDLSGDGLTRTGVQRIAHAILDVPGNTPSGAPASAGDSWNTLMRNIARATGGVYYISPDKDLFYVDVETVSSNYTLTDTPTGAFDLGYQNFELLENGSDLINDMFVWGAGTGTPNYVYSRTTDATSVSTHGRWQSALVTGGLFRQTSADTVSHSYVYGTPQSHRGGKDNAVRVTCRVFKPYFKAGQKVQVNIGIFGYSDVLPIRSMAIKFVNRTQAYFDLLLSHVIDLPVLIYETRFFNPANIDITHPTIAIPPPPQAAPPLDCNCGTTDKFNRFVSLTTHSGGTDNIGAYLGAASSGPTWDVLLRSSVAVSVNGSQASIAFGDITSGGGLISASLPLPFPVAYDSTVVHSFQFILDSLGDATRPREESLRLTFTIGGSLPQRATVWIFPSNTSLWLQGSGPTPAASAYSQITWTSDLVGGTQIPLLFWVAGVTYTFSIYVNAGVTYAAVSDGVSTYSVSIGSSHPIISELSLLLQRALTGGTALTAWTVYLDNLVVPEITVCTLYKSFDDFTRTVSPGGFGNATPSTLAWSFFSGDASHFSVPGTYGQIRTGGTGTTSDKIAVDAPADTFWSANGYEMNAEFALDNYIPASLLELTFAERTDFSLFIQLLIGTDPGGANPPGSSPPGPGYWGYSISGNTDVFGPAISWVLGTYRLRAVVRPGIDLQVKVWNVLNAEPSTFTVVSNTSDPFHAGSHTFRIDAFNNDFGNPGATFTDVQFEYIDVRYNGMPCPPGAPLAPVSAHVGWVTETFVATAGQLLILLANAFQVYTPEVSINGTRQIPTTYVESPNAGTVLLDTALTAGDDVVVRYYATGAIQI